MVIDLSKIDHEQFMVHEHILNGEICYLIQPQFIGTKWTQENKIFRSSLWNFQGELISAGFPKFVNFNENPEQFPVPTSLDNTTIVEKIDGSLLIVSKYKGNYILRTRGTSDAYTLDNGYELDIFKKEILPNIGREMGDDETWGCSYLFEWVSPKNKIVLSYGNVPEWYLVGIVRHEDYYMGGQLVMDAYAKYNFLKRPVSYTFPSIEELIRNVELWKGKEGIVLYSSDGQVLHKCKSVWYLNLHRMKSELSSLDKVIDVWMGFNKPSSVDFYNKICEVFDFELANQCQSHITTIENSYNEVKKIIDEMNIFVKDVLSPLPTRKEQAVKVLEKYGPTGRSAFVFRLLDKKELTDIDLKKLIVQIIENNP